MHRFGLGIAFSVLACALVPQPHGALGADADAQVGGTPNAQMQAVLDDLASLKPKPIETLTPAEARKQPSPADAVMKRLKQEGKTPKAEMQVREKNDTIPSRNGPIPIRVYTPAGKGPFPVVVYYHGGGFVFATIDTYESSCRAICDMAGCVVVSVEYRKAPENKFPAAVDDAFAAYQWVAKNTALVGGDSKRVAVAGESAGGNLATEVCIKSVEANVAPPIYELLVYPVVNNDMNTESYKVNADAKPLNKAMMAWFFEQYLTEPASGTDPHVSPMRAGKDVLAKLPPTMVITDSIDPLMSEGQAYAEKLKAAGVSVTHKNYPGVTHEFFGMGAVVDTAKEAEQDASAGLKKAFGE